MKKLILGKKMRVIDMEVKTARFETWVVEATDQWAEHWEASDPATGFQCPGETEAIAIENLKNNIEAQLQKLK